MNSIWEGSGNVQCLDVLRAFRREPETRDALLGELLQARGAHPDFDLQLNALMSAFNDLDALEMRSRHVVERMALLLQASLLFQSDQTAMAETFCRARLGNERSLVYGALDTQAPVAALIARALPEL